MNNNRAIRKCKQKALQNYNKVCKKYDTSSRQAAQDCVVCLDVVVCRGVLSVCDHWFCFECIFEWAKSTNTCPLCKLRFRCITKVSLVPGGSPKQTFRIKDKNQSNIVIAEDDYEVALGLVNEETSTDEDNHDADETFYPSPGRAQSRVLYRPSRTTSRQHVGNSRTRRTRQSQIIDYHSSSTTSSRSLNILTTSNNNFSAAMSTTTESNSQVSSKIYSDTSEDEMSESSAPQQRNVKKRRKRTRIVYQSPRRKKNNFKPPSNSEWINMNFKCTTQPCSSTETTSQENNSSSSEFEENVFKGYSRTNRSTRMHSLTVFNENDDSPVIRSTRIRSQNNQRIEDDSVSEESPSKPLPILSCMANGLANSENSSLLFGNSDLLNFSVNDSLNQLSPCILSQHIVHQTTKLSKENANVSDSLQSSPTFTSSSTKFSSANIPITRSAYCSPAPLRDINNIIRPTPQKKFTFKSLRQSLY